MNNSNDSTRIANSKKNIKVATISQLVSALLGFIERAFFINYLSSELLGLKGLIMSILMVLTITEYGISSSLAFYLYEPLVNNNQDKIKSLIRYMRKVYNSMSFGVFIFGLALLPIFPTIANTTNINPNTTRLYFLIYLIGTSVSLRVSSHAIIIQADQKQYITTFYISSAQILQLIAQIVVLVFTQNFYLYALMFSIANGTKFLFVKHKAKKLFPYLKGKTKTFNKLPKEVLNKIKKETVVLIFHKMGFSITMSIECILLSYFLGASTLGIFTNYQLVILGIATGMAFLQKSFESSIGNLCTIETKEKAYDWFLKINHVYSLTFGYLIVLLMSLFIPFFQLFYPNAVTFDYFTTFLISLSIYLFYKRLIVSIYESSYGIFYQDRYKPFVQTLISIFLSIILGKNFGEKGIFSAIIISELLTSTWIEPHMVFKYGFKTTAKPYWSDYLKNILIVVITAAISFYFSKHIKQNLFVTFLLNYLITTISYLIVLTIIFPKNGISILKWLLRKSKGEKINMIGINANNNIINL